MNSTGLSFRNDSSNTRLDHSSVDDALSQFDPSKDFNAIVSSRKATWHQWVKEKIDGGDFRNRALKVGKAGQQEINLSDMSEHVKPDRKNVGTD